MEKRGDIEPGRTPPEAVACKKRVEEIKQRLFPFVHKMASEENARTDAIDTLDSDFRNVAAQAACRSHNQ